MATIGRHVSSAGAFDNRVYILTGEHEKALDRLEPLLKIPYHLTPAWLEIDPNFDTLRQNPRFQMLIGKGLPRAAS